MNPFYLCSNPFEGNFKGQTAQLASANYLALLNRAQKMIEVAGEGPDPWLSQIQAFIKSHPATIGYWIPEISTAFYALQSLSTKASMAWIRSQLILGGHLCGALERFDLTLSHPAMPLYVAGEIIQADHLVLVGTRSRLRICDGRGVELLSLHLRGHANQRNLWSRHSDAKYVTLSRQSAIPLVNESWDRQWGNEARETHPLDQAVLDQFNHAFDFLEEHLPEYSEWVTHVTAELTPLCRPGIHTIGSSSSDGRWGGLNIAHPASVTESVEMLIHEASHQYFHMVNMFGPMVSPDAGEFYSPLKQCKRPLDRILLGFHAFANASLAFEGLMQKGFGKDIWTRKQCVDSYMRELIAPLESEKGLAPLGLALYKPLRRRIDHLFCSTENVNGIVQ